MEHLLIIDDNTEILNQLKWGFSRDYSVHLASSRESGLIEFKKCRAKVVILDLGLPPLEETSEEGFNCLQQILEIGQDVKVIVMTGNSEQSNALKAVSLGAYDFYPKPPDLSELRIIISRAFHLANIEAQNKALIHKSIKGVSSLPGIIGESVEILSVSEMIRKVSTTDAPVLITGESGTGKELAARAIHELSLRNNNSFIPINCGAIPEDLLESELFGHIKGAFTSANSSVTGKIQSADKGTLFLDELGELPVKLQVKLLRFLQDGVIQKVGSTEFIKVDTRVVCATNIDPAKAISDGKLREDLYYRVGVVSIHLPPLRERGCDVQLLAAYFLNQFNKQYGKKIKRISKTALDSIQAYGWPGNVRELQNRIQRAVIMTEKNQLEADDLNLPTVLLTHLEPEALTMTLKNARELFEKDILLKSLLKNDWNIVKTSEELGVSRPTLYDLMKKHSISYKQG